MAAAKTTLTGTRVAVLGASGIGKHHAKWWTLEGADVCAILGTTATRCAATADMLSGMFGFEGRTYTDLDALLEAERPAIVDVCTPPALHADHVRRALRAGCHVLCEKPFVYNCAATGAELIAEARALVTLAGERNRLLGVATQYAVAAREAMKLEAAAGHATPVRDFVGELASPLRPCEPMPWSVWIDLAPHMLAAARVVSGSGAPRWETLDLETGPKYVRARLVFGRPDGPDMKCMIYTHRTAEEPKNVRRLVIDGREYRFEGRNDEAGIFRADIHGPEDIVTMPDMMHLLIRDFAAGQADVTAADAVDNLAWMLRPMGHPRPGREDAPPADDTTG